MDRQEKVKLKDGSENGSENGSNEDSDAEDKVSAVMAMRFGVLCMFCHLICILIMP